jgi:hypothetical protein
MLAGPLLGASSLARGVDRTSAKEETVRKDQHFHLQDLREALPEAEAVRKEQAFHLQGLREALPEADAPVVVQLLSGRVVWNANTSPTIRKLQRVRGLPCLLRVYDIKCALKQEYESEMKTRPTFQKLFDSDDLAEFHACSDFASVAPKPLADIVILSPGTTLTLCQVAEQNEVADVDAMLQGLSLSHG